MQHVKVCKSGRTISCDILNLNLVEFSNEEKWSLLIEPKQNSTIAQLSGIQHKIIRFFQSRKYETVGHEVF